MAKTGSKSPTDDEDDKAVLNRIEALAKLETELAEAATNFKSDAIGRRGAQNALVAVYRFLCAVKIPRTSSSPIVRLAIALGALDQGKVLPLTKPKRVSTAHPLAEGEGISRAVAAAALELRYRELKKQGSEKPYEKAAAWVAYSIRDWVELTTCRGNPTGVVKRWRAEMSERKPKDIIFMLYRGLICQEPGRTAEQLLKREQSEWGIQTKKSEQPPS